MEKKKFELDISLAAILKVTAVILALFFIYYIIDILVLVFLALFLSAVIEPLVNSLEKRRIPRGLGVIFIYVFLLLLIITLVWMITPPISQQIGLLISNFPELWDKFTDNFAEAKQLSIKYGFYDNLEQSFGGLEAGISRAATGVYAFAVSFFKDIVNIVFVLVLTFYLVLENDAINKVFRAILPIKYLPRWTKVYADIQVKIGEWARGQLILGLIIGLMVFAGLIFIVPKYALILAVIAGLLEMVPYLGPILSAIPAVFLGFMVPTTSLVRGVAVLILYIVIQQAENHIIVPQVMKRQLGLNPVITIIAMLIGARIFGIIGIILAIPVTTAITIIVNEIGRKKTAVEKEI